MDTHAKLLHAVTTHDRAESKKKYYNPNALALYCRGLQNVRRRVDIGQPLRDAIITEFNGRLCDKLLTAAGLDRMTDAEARRGLAVRLPDLPDDE